MPRSMLVMAALWFATASVATADTYHYTVDRFEVDGNVHGPLDGTPDLVEEFDDGMMGPTFGPIAGTTSEAGGLLHLDSPGTDVAIPGVTPTRFETSAVVHNSWSTALRVGSGDLVARMAMPVQAIGANDAVNLLVQSVDGNGLYYAGVSIINFNSALAAQTNPPMTPGLAILAHQEVINSVTGNQQLLQQGESIIGAPISGGIVLELRYDDSSQTVTPRYSLDGGATFAGSFDPLPIETGNGTATFYLAAVAHEGACPAAAAIRSLHLRGLGKPGRSGFLLKGGFGLLGRSPGDVRLVITDEGDGGAPIFDVHLPDRFPGTVKCDPRDGWSFQPSQNRYRNYSDAMPPACSPGSAQGLQKWTARYTGSSPVVVKVKKTSLPPIVGPLRVSLFAAGGPVNECDGVVATLNCDVRPGAATCAP